MKNPGGTIDDRKDVYRCAHVKLTSILKIVLPT
jgi:hypothetical protein